MQAGGNVYDEDESEDIGDRLYDELARPLEQDHYGEFIAITRDGRILLGPTLTDVMVRAKEAFGPGNFVFKIGPRAVGRMSTRVWLGAQRPSVREFVGDGGCDGENENKSIEQLVADERDRRG